MFDLKRDGKTIFTGTEDECYAQLHRVCPGSWEHAMKYEGYTIEPATEEKKICPACGRNELNPDIAMNALSRYCGEYICNECGTKEAFEGDFWHRKCKLCGDNLRMEDDLKCGYHNLEE